VPQERTAGAAIALAFAQLQAVDMALAGPSAPGQGEPRCDGRESLPQVALYQKRYIHPPHATNTMRFAWVSRRAGLTGIKPGMTCTPRPPLAGIARVFAYSGIGSRD
jgi:hypothetical protein